MSSNDPVGNTDLADGDVEPEPETPRETVAPNARATLPPAATAARRRVLDLSEGQPALHELDCQVMWVWIISQYCPSKS
jgi:hypothetical protein